MASKNKNLAELLDANGDVLATNLDNATITSVSDQDNTSTGSLTVPKGTTAQEPDATDNAGQVRYDTDKGVLTYSDGTQWYKVSAELAVLDSVSGSIYPGYSSTLTLTGSGFLTDDITVNFTQSSDGIDEDVVVTASSDTSATVTVPANVYNNVTAGNVVTIRVTNSDLSTSDSVTKTAASLPSGGTITTSGNYRIHTFSTGTTNFVLPYTLDLEYLIVAGGGGGGGGANATWHGGGGGGAGGLLTNVGGSALSKTAATYSIVVGAGGSGGSGGNSQGNNGTNGSNSSALGLTAIGGGFGLGAKNSSASTGGNGGSGGGGAWTEATSPTSIGQGGSGTSGQGNDGGFGDSSTYPFGGAGGGAGGAGGDRQENVGSPPSSYVGGGVGGVGLSNSITGTAVYYAGGGGGGGAETGGSGAYGGAGGNGGGAAGSQGQVNASAGTDGLGGGGGGGYGGATQYSGGDGGDGVVIIRYDTTTLP